MIAGITILFAVAWIITALLHRASAAMRHMIWTCAFAAALLLGPLRWRAPHRVIAPAIPSIPVITTPAAVAVTPATPRSVDVTTVLIWIWILGTAVLLFRLAINVVRLRAIVKSARGALPVLVSSRVKGPFAVGLWRPAILLPENSATWSISRRRAVLAHESAHIRRRDPLILFASQIATAIYWFHPLCWLAAARLRAESERACDDAALRIGLRPSGYAGHLLELACRFDPQLAIPMATTSHLESRVKSILDPMTNRSVPVRSAWLAAIGLTVIVLAPLATFTLRAQQSTGTGTATITGTVSDPSGAAVANAQVTAINSDTGTREMMISNAVGSYTFNDLPGGYYAIEVQVPGFAPFRLENLAVINGGKLETNARLRVGGIAERITVAARGTPKSPSANSAPQGRVRVGGVVQAARLIRQVSPIYPDGLQAEGIEGTVQLAAIISRDGVPSSLKVMKNGGNDEFANAALAAVQQWRYQPTLLNGEPTEVLTNIQVDFKLSAQAPIIDDRVLPLGIPRK